MISPFGTLPLPSQITPSLTPIHPFPFQDSIRVPPPPPQQQRMSPIPTQMQSPRVAPTMRSPRVAQRQMSPVVNHNQLFRDPPQPQLSPKPQSPANGYSLLSAQDAERLLNLLQQNSGGDFNKRREVYVAQQRSMRSWKVDFVTKEECMEVAGEISPSFIGAVDLLGIFESDSDCNIMYKKVPKTSNENLKNNRKEDLAYMFERWMQIDSESIQLVPKEFTDRKFKVWNSLRYMNIHGSYCEVFVVCSEFNRHLFHKEILM